MPLTHIPSTKTRHADRALTRFGFLALLTAAFLTACSKKPADADALTVGFAQIGAESGWRTANTKSIRSEAEARGINLKFTDAQGKPENQLRAVRTFIQQRVDVIAFPASVATGWDAVLEDAKKAGIPVVFTDRKATVADESLYACFIGADFVEEGRQAARWLVEATGGNARIAELEGSPGSDPAIDRAKGFREVIAEHPGMTIIKSQSGDFSMAKGKEVAESFLRSPEGPQITAFYAHNDEMALGAAMAIKAAGRKPGTEILIVSVDGQKNAMEAILAGELNCTIECNPMIGPLLFDVARRLHNGETVDRWVKTEARVFDASNLTPELVAARAY